MTRERDGLPGWGQGLPLPALAPHPNLDLKRLYGVFLDVCSLAACHWPVSNHHAYDDRGDDDGGAIDFPVSITASSQC
jgi:hypothetical protein